MQILTPIILMHRNSELGASIEMNTNAYPLSVGKHYVQELNWMQLIVTMTTRHVNKDLTPMHGIPERVGQVVLIQCTVSQSVLQTVKCKSVLTPTYKMLDLITET